ncbi:MAG: hypothetical protein BWX88_03954 [Planctomycetes bacterium ADurb.Bin126]|nr:MAG: hypothetical protein BWX88_03954 [Planctomycetes bacterium ADurb.Bin126]HOD80329.1 lysophospholipid acyltransferase family protein [Phycisphaerae bacterium]HQL75090.1 lysophospholipid acyltransferase family protein [Phycisphaerae bacterium]
MRIRLTHPVAVRAAALIGSFLIRLWMRTLRLGFDVPRPEDLPCNRRRPGIYLFWHEHLLLPAYTHARERLAMLISTHRDGELIAQTLACLGGRAIRGSTTRGGAAALRRMLLASRDTHLAITPDGPRGPRRVVQAGAVYLASRSGMSIFPVGFAFDRPWRAHSWDRTAVPRPFSVGRGVLGPAIRVPDGLDREGIETWRQTVQAAMEAVQRQAERLAATERGDRKLTGLSGVRRA